MVICDSTGNIYKIQDCCGAWDRFRGFHFSKCSRVQAVIERLQRENG